jgi:glucose-6-phosphate dehydrogenase assembly protein OpcA
MGLGFLSRRLASTPMTRRLIAKARIELLSFSCRLFVEIIVRGIADREYF